MTAISLKQALQSAKGGRAILFTGAGFSVGFTDSNGKELLPGKALANEISLTAGALKTDDLRVAGKKLLAHLGAEGYADYIRDRFSVAEPTPDAIGIASENWARVYTTNFDDGFEVAAVRAQRRVRSATMADTVAEFQSNTRSCVHIHGYVAKINAATVDKDIILTLPAYGSSPFPNSPWKTLFKHDLLAAEAVFFVGYSLGDLDISRILDECDPSIKGKLFFIVRESGDDDVKSLLEDYGTICEIGREGFYVQLSNTDTRPSELDETYPGFEELRIPSAPKAVVDADIYRLYMSGMVVDDLVLGETTATDKERKYTVERTYAWGQIQKCLRADEPNFFALTSEVSNGKSIALLQALRNLRLANFRVFRLVDTTANWVLGLRRIFQLQGVTVAVGIDKCTLHEDIAAEAIRFARKGDVVLIADRTELIEYPLNRLADGREERFLEIDLDQLGQLEREQFVEALSRHGMWGDLANASNEWKDRAIQREVDNQIRGILLGILESPKALELLNETVRDINFQDPFYDGLVLALIISVTEAVECRLDVIDDLSASAPLRRVLAASSGARALVRVRSPNQVQTVSALIASVVLRKVIPVDVVVRCITNAIVESQSFLRTDTHSYFPRRMMQFRLIQQVLPEKQSHGLKAVQEIYQSIKGLPQFAREPQFWLQYAICSLFLGEYGRAELYFKQAYGLCPPGYDKRKIDNHYARYLIESSIEGPTAPMEPAQAWSILTQAKALLQSQFSEEGAHYPFRVASNIERYSNTYSMYFDKSQLLELLSFVKFILEHATRMIEHGNSNKYIMKCRIALNRTQQALTKRVAELPIASASGSSAS